MSKEAEYDPQSAAISSAYVSAFNDYVRNSLKFGEKLTYKPEIDVEKNWISCISRRAPNKRSRHAQRDAGPRGRDEAEPKIENHAERRLL